MNLCFTKDGFGIYLFAQTIMCMGNRALAQTEKNRYLVGGSSDISEMVQGTSSSFNLSLSPSFGVFVVKNFAIGGLLSFGISNVRPIILQPNLLSHN